jgi:hypothetical protein
LVGDLQFNSSPIDDTLIPAVAQCVAAHPECPWASSSVG